MNKTILEKKYKNLLDEHRKLAIASMSDISIKTELTNLITDLAIHCSLEYGKMSPKEIIEKAKSRITKIHLVN